MVASGRPEVKGRDGAVVASQRVGGIIAPFRRYIVTTVKPASRGSI